MNQSYFNRYGNFSALTKHIIIINVLLWLANKIMIWKFGADLTNTLGLHFPTSDKFNIFQFVTYMFVHDPRSITHVFFNMFALYVFGQVIENHWGSKRFILYYLVTGIGAAVIQELVWYYMISDIAASNHITFAQQIDFDTSINFMSTVGASGSVFGLLLAFGILFPNVPLYIMFIPVPIKAKYMVAGYGVIELLLGVANFSGDNVAHFAHLGGMLFGIVLILYWKKKDKENGRNFY